MFNRRFAAAGGEASPCRDNLSLRHCRTLQVAKIRWLLLILLGAFGVCAASLFSFSSYGFFLTKTQTTILVLAVAMVVSYNTLFYFHFEKTQGKAWLDPFQIVLDLIAVTLLIHFSGGGASWFWPVYLVVTIEAAFLLERSRDVWTLGALGGGLYGALLLAESSGLIPYVTMPFVDNALHHDTLHQWLMWIWVSVLNATVAIICAFLMAAMRRQTRAHQDMQERLLDFLHSANDLIFSFTPNGNFLFVNHTWTQTLGYNENDLVDMSLMDILHPDSRSHCLDEFRKALEGDKVNCVDGYFISKSGDKIAVEGNMTRSIEDGKPVALWAICRDVTERKQAQDQLYHLAHHDTLTGLPNRLLFLDRLKQAKALARRLNYKLAVLFLDLDRFKLINDTLGHPVGDKMLQGVASRLTSCVREIDTVARLGGDEFTIVLANLTSPDDVELVAQKILKALAKPLKIDKHELFITTSIGITMFPEHGDEATELIKKADLAMYHAKAQGRNNYQFYAAEMDLDADRRLLMETGLRKALDNDEFILFYQPKVDSVTSKITSLEALLRWNHPQLGMIPPGEFISLAEETGMILAIGEWVIREACRQNRAWQDAGIPPVRVAVNLSGYQLQQQDLIASVKEILGESRIDPSLLELEITETVIMQNPDFAVSILTELRQLGIHLSIDDFGTGYSSLAHLKRFAVNTIKIDKAFVRDVDTNSTDAAIATAIISMGSSLNLKVIAEGVETEGQLSFLRDRHCSEMQGYLFSRPVPADEVAKLLVKAPWPTNGGPPEQPEER